MGANINSVPPARSWLTRFRALEPDADVAPGVTAAQMLEFHARRPDPAGARFQGDVVYGMAGRPLTLDVYRRADPSETAPGLVFFHGGGWREHAPDMHQRYIHAFAAAGYVTASVGFRQSWEAAWPACLEDAKCAVRWLRRHASTLGLDPEHIGVAGNSAGGQLAAMVALTPGRHEGDGGWSDVSSAVAAACLLYPMTDLRDGQCPELAPAISELFGSAASSALQREASPVHQLRPDGPPMLTLCGTADTLTPIEMIRAFDVRAKAVGAPHQLIEIPEADHGFDLYPTGWDLAYQPMARFFATALGVAAR